MTDPEKLADIKSRYRAELAGLNLDDLSADQLERLVHQARDRQFAVIMAGMLTLAAKSEPELIRAALAECFDLSLWEAQGREIEIKFRDLALRLGAQWADRQSVTLLEKRNVELISRIEVAERANAALVQRVLALESAVEKARGWASGIQKRHARLNGKVETPTQHPNPRTK
jgi:hypothetical protein